jgi:hypothetical protein
LEIKDDGGMTVFTLINLGPHLESYSLHDEKSFFRHCRPCCCVCLRWWIMYEIKHFVWSKIRPTELIHVLILALDREPYHWLKLNKHFVEIESAQKKLILGPSKVGLGLRKWTLATHSPTHPANACWPASVNLYLLTHSLNHTHCCYLHLPKWGVIVFVAIIII